jgi:hypothetical protein
MPSTEHNCYGRIFCGVPRNIANAACPAHQEALARRLRNANIEWDLYPSLEDPTEPDWAPYVRMGECREHPGRLEAITGTTTIPTGPGDLCDVGVFACGTIVAEDVF